MVCQRVLCPESKLARDRAGFWALDARLRARVSLEIAGGHVVVEHQLAERTRKREDLLQATERGLGEIAERVKNGTLNGAAQIGLAVGPGLKRYRVKEHFEIEITDTSFTYERKLEQIAAEARGRTRKPKPRGKSSTARQRQVTSASLDPSVAPGPGRRSGVSCLSVGLSRRIGAPKPRTEDRVKTLKATGGSHLPSTDTGERRVARSSRPPRTTDGPILREHDYRTCGTRPTASTDAYLELCPTIGSAARAQAPADRLGARAHS